MCPDIPLRHPDNLFNIRNVIAIFFAGIHLVHNQKPVINERRTLLRNETVWNACRRGDVNHPIHLMPSLVVLKR